MPGGGGGGTGMGGIEKPKNLSRVRVVKAIPWRTYFKSVGS